MRLRKNREKENCAMSLFVSNIKKISVLFSSSEGYNIWGRFFHVTFIYMESQMKTSKVSLEFSKSKLFSHFSSMYQSLLFISLNIFSSFLRSKIRFTTFPHKSRIKPNQIKKPDYANFEKLICFFILIQQSSFTTTFPLLLAFYSRCISWTAILSCIKLFRKTLYHWENSVDAWNIRN